MLEGICRRECWEKYVPGNVKWEKYVDEIVEYWKRYGADTAVNTIQQFGFLFFLCSHLDYTSICFHQKHENHEN